MQSCLVVLSVSVIFRNAYSLDIVANCDLPNFPSVGGSSFTLYNNSVHDTFRHNPPRPFLGDFSFALAWNRHTLHTRDNVNLTIKCNNIQFHWYRANFVRSFRPHSSLLCWSKDLRQVSLPCNSDCFLAFGWKANDTTSISKIITQFWTSTHEPVGVVNVTRIVVGRDTVVIRWKVHRTISCSEVTDLQVVLNSNGSVHEHRFLVLEYPLNVTLPSQWTQGGEAFFFNVSMRYCTKLGCSPFSRTMLLSWNPAEEEFPDPVGTPVSTPGAVTTFEASQPFIIAGLAVMAVVLLTIFGVMCCCMVKLLRSTPNYQLANSACRSQQLTMKELQLTRPDEEFDCAATIPKDCRTEYTTVNEQPGSDLHNEFDKEEMPERISCEGQEDCSDVEDSNVLLILGPDNQLS